MVKIVFGDTTIGFNPISKESKGKQVRFGADIAIVSTNHPDTNGVDVLTHGSKEPFVITSPGEYEISGVTIKGFPSQTAYGDNNMNTIYLVTLEGMTICFLGLLSSLELPSSVRESLDAIDILFIPIGGEGTIAPQNAHKLAVSIGARLVIPIQYDADTVKTFLKESGNDSIRPIDKLTIKKKDLEDKDGEVVVLEVQ